MAWNYEGKSRPFFILKIVSDILLSMDDCIFCKIASKTEAAKILYEDERVIAFETIEPVSKGHTLVVPKQHFQNILDIDQDLLLKITSVAQKLANELVASYNTDGVNILHAAGKVAQQSVLHFHFHIVPRYENDGLDLWLRNNL